VAIVITRSSSLAFRIDARTTGVDHDVDATRSARGQARVARRRSRWRASECGGECRLVFKFNPLTIRDIDSATSNISDLDILLRLRAPMRLTE